MSKVKVSVLLQGLHILKVVLSPVFLYLNYYCSLLIAILSFFSAKLAKSCAPLHAVEIPDCASSQSNSPSQCLTEIRFLNPFSSPKINIEDDLSEQVVCSRPPSKPSTPVSLEEEYHLVDEYVRHSSDTDSCEEDSAQDAIIVDKQSGLLSQPGDSPCQNQVIDSKLEPFTNCVQVLETGNDSRHVEEMVTIELEDGAQEQLNTCGKVIAEDENILCIDRETAVSEQKSEEESVVNISSQQVEEKTEALDSCRVDNDEEIKCNKESVGEILTTGLELMSSKLLVEDVLGTQKSEKTDGEELDKCVHSPKQTEASRDEEFDVLDESDATNCSLKCEKIPRKSQRLFREKKKWKTKCLELKDADIRDSGVPDKKTCEYGGSLISNRTVDKNCNLFQPAVPLGSQMPEMQELMVIMSKAEEKLIHDFIQQEERAAKGKVLKSSEGSRSRSKDKMADNLVLRAFEDQAGLKVILSCCDKNVLTSKSGKVNRCKRSKRIRSRVESVPDEAQGSKTESDGDQLKTDIVGVVVDMDQLNSNEAVIARDTYAECKTTRGSDCERIEDSVPISTFDAEESSSQMASLEVVVNTSAAPVKQALELDHMEQSRKVESKAGFPAIACVDGKLKSVAVCSSSENCKNADMKCQSINLKSKPRKNKKRKRFMYSDPRRRNRHKPVETEVAQAINSSMIWLESETIVLSSEDENVQDPLAMEGDQEDCNFDPVENPIESNASYMPSGMTSVCFPELGDPQLPCVSDKASRAEILIDLVSDSGSEFQPEEHMNAADESVTFKNYFF